MRRYTSALFLVLLLAGCNPESSSNKAASVQRQMDMVAPPGSGAMMKSPSPYFSSDALSAQAEKARLAYRHMIELEAPATSLAAHFDRARGACLKREELKCLVIEASLTLPQEAGNNKTPPHAILRIRLPHANIAPFEAILHEPLPGQKETDLTLRSRTTTADDLSRVITDTERRQAQLVSYRDRLTALAARKDSRVEDMIRIEQELSKVQTDIETAEATKKVLQERVDTEEVHLNFMTPYAEWQNQSTPISNMWREAGTTLAESTASALRFVIVMIPWLPLLALAVYAVRRLRRHWRQEKKSGV